MSKNTLHVMQPFDKMCETGCASWKKSEDFCNQYARQNKQMLFFHS